MKFGVREITDVVFRATASGQKLGSLTTTSAYQPLLFLDSAKTSTVESAVATVYAQGGRGNPRLLAWDGDKTVTFTFEDALISSGSFAALSGGELTEGSPVNIHLTEKTIAQADTTNSKIVITGLTFSSTTLPVDSAGNTIKPRILILDSTGDVTSLVSLANTPTGVLANAGNGTGTLTISGISTSDVPVGASVLVDFYVTQSSGKKLEISAEKFAGYYYLEANTLFRGTDGKDYPAQFTIPKAKIQSNFTFTMAPTGDPSTFTFTLDAFPAVTRFGGTKKVLFSLDISDISSDVI